MSKSRKKSHISTPRRVLVFGLSSNLGGTETVFDTFYDYLVEHGYDFDFVARDGNVALQEKYMKNGARFFNVPSFVRQPVKYYSIVKKIIREGDYDVVYVNLLSAANVLPIIAAKKTKRSRTVAHSHNNNTTGIARKILHPLGKCFLKGNIVRVACSEEAGKFIFGNSSFAIINNPFDYDKFIYKASYRKEIRDKYGIEDDCKILGAVGRLSEQKNFVFLVDVLRRLRGEYCNNVKLMIIGNGKLKKAIEAKATEYNVQDSLIMIENVCDINKYYSAMDLFLLPSIYEGLGMVSLEAQAAGLSCIFSTAVPRKVGLIEKNFLELDDELWSNTAMELLTGKAKARRTDNNEVFEDMFGIKKNARLLMKAFEGVQNAKED